MRNDIPTDKNGPVNERWFFLKSHSRKGKNEFSNKPGRSGKRQISFPTGRVKKRKKKKVENKTSNTVGHYE